MQGADTINTAWEHAAQIAEVLTAHGATVEEIQDAERLTWKLACSIADVPAEAAASGAVRRIVVTKLRDAGTHPDPFAGIGF